MRAYHQSVDAKAMKTENGWKWNLKSPKERINANLTSLEIGIYLYMIFPFKPDDSAPDNFHQFHSSHSTGVTAHCGWSLRHFKDELVASLQDVISRKNVHDNPFSLNTTGPAASALFLDLEISVIEDIAHPVAFNRLQTSICHIDMFTHALIDSASSLKRRLFPNHWSY